MMKKLLIVLLILVPTFSYAQDCLKLDLEMDIQEVQSLLGVNLENFVGDWDNRMNIDDDISRNYRVMEEYIPTAPTDFDERSIVYFDTGIMKLAFANNKLIYFRSELNNIATISDELSMRYGAPIVKETSWDEDDEQKKDDSLCLAWENKDELVLFYKQELIKIARRTIPSLEVTSIKVIDANEYEQ